MVSAVLLGPRSTSRGPGINCATEQSRPKAQRLRRTGGICCFCCFSWKFSVSGPWYSVEILAFDRSKLENNSGALAVFSADIRRFRYSTLAV